MEFMREPTTIAYVDNGKPFSFFGATTGVAATGVTMAAANTFWHSQFFEGKKSG